MNNSIEQIMDIINDKVGDYISDGMYQDLKSDITFALAEKDNEIERLSKRDGNASIELCYDDGFNPFARSDCKHLDFGVADNCYVVESELLNKTLEENKRLRDMCEKMAYVINELCEEMPEHTGMTEEGQNLLSAYNAMKSGQPASEPMKEAGK